MCHGKGGREEREGGEGWMEERDREMEGRRPRRKGGRGEMEGVRKKSDIGGKVMGKRERKGGKGGRGSEGVEEW